MKNSLKQYAARFDAQTTRERALIAITLLALLIFCWWSFYYQPLQQQLQQSQQENSRIASDLASARALVAQTRQRIASGVHQGKLEQLARLRTELNRVEQQLQVKTVELIDPEKMFKLMNRLIYSDSRLKLLSLKRREVKPAIPVTADQPEDQGIYRHVLEIHFSGKFLDILRYMQSLEQLDWKLLWDEIEIVNQEYPLTTVKVVISTLSTRKEWVGI